MRIRKIYAVLFIIFFMVNIFSIENKKLESIDSWAIWLQKIDLNKIQNSNYDLFVIDYSKDGSASGAFSLNQINEIKKSGKIILSYISIGEAEEYRFYWNKKWKKEKPAFIGPENPDWKGNYKVKYWEESWWDQCLKPYLDIIIQNNYDGIYLDIVDAYYYWGEKTQDTFQKHADSMIDLILKISTYTKGKTGRDFIICPQNAAAIIDDASPEQAKEYLKTISFIGAEDVFYNYYSEEDYLYTLELLKKFNKAGIKILNIEYINKLNHKKYRNMIVESGLNIIGYASTIDRELDSLTENF